MITQNPDYLIAIVECGNLTKAAERLYISQPSLSQYLKRLETSLGTELFDRTSSPMKLNYAGERYYEYILQMKQMELNIHEELAQIKHETKGRIRLGIAVWRGACLIPDIYPEFHRRYPNVSIELHEGRFIQNKTALSKYEVDLMIANLLTAGEYSEFDVEIINQEKILLAVPTCCKAYKTLMHSTDPGCGRNEFPRISLDRLSSLPPLVLTKEGQSLTEMITSMLARNRITLDILMRTANLTTAINLTAKGVCCTFVPAEGAKICQHPGEIEFYELDGIELSWSLAFLMRKESYIGPVTRGFMDCVKELLNQPVS